MNTEAHLAVGWCLAHVGSRTDRRFLGVVTLASLIPDIDALGYVGGEHVYAAVHHALGHNLFFAMAVSGAAMGFWWRGKRRISENLLGGMTPQRASLVTIFFFTQLAFYLHYFGDYFLTRFPLEFFWPLSHKGYIYSYRIGLDHPINLVLGYLSFVVMIVMAMVYKHTPVELVWPELDRRLVNLFRRKSLACHLCASKANERCIVCNQPVCLKHGQLNRHAQVRCRNCGVVGRDSGSNGERAVV